MSGVKTATQLHDDVKATGAKSIETEDYIIVKQETRTFFSGYEYEYSFVFDKKNGRMLRCMGYLYQHSPALVAVKEVYKDPTLANTKKSKKDSSDL